MTARSGKGARLVRAGSKTSRTRLAVEPFPATNVGPIGHWWTSGPGLSKHRVLQHRSADHPKILRCIASDLVQTGLLTVVAPVPPGSQGDHRVEVRTGDRT